MDVNWQTLIESISLRDVLGGVVIPLTGWALKKISGQFGELVNQISRLADQQVKFNERLLAVEIKNGAELEYLKQFAVQHETRIQALEQN